MSTRAAIYARVSSAAQREAHTIESQLHVLRPFVERQGWALVGTYVDDGRSAKTGKLDKRDGFAQLLTAATSGQVDVLVTTAMDRLTRTEDLIELASILGPFQRAGIPIVSPTRGEIDLRTTHGTMMAILEAQAAAIENTRRAERIKAGKLRAIAEGRKPAGPTPFGLAYSRTAGQWSIDEAAAAIVREIFRRVAGGESCVAIADDLAIRGAAAPRAGWSRAGVYRIVRSRHVLGEWHADKARGAVITVPAILTEDEWAAAQRALLAHRRRGLRRTKHVYLLEGIARCACGAPIAIRSATRNPRRTNGNPSPAAYVCRARKLERACIQPIVKTAELDARVWAALVDELAQPGLVEALATIDAEHAAEARDWARDAAGYRAHLARLQRHEAAMIARARRGLISHEALDVELAAIGKERKGVRAQLESAEDALSATVDEQTRLRAAGEALGEICEALAEADVEDRRELLRALVRDGGVIIADGRARLDLRLPRAAARSRVAAGASLSIVHGDRPGSRTEHETISGRALRLRLVA